MSYQEMKQIAETTNIPCRKQLVATELIELIQMVKNNQENAFDIISTVYAYGYHVGKHDTTKKK